MMANAYTCMVATISRLLKIIGLFCRISSLSQGSFAKETCYFKEPTTCNHPIVNKREIEQIHFKKHGTYLNHTHVEQ